MSLNSNQTSQIKSTTVAVALVFATAASGLLNDNSLDSNSAKFLTRKGLTPEEVGGYGYGSCSGSKFEVFSTKFRARDGNGATHTGVVCTSLTGASRLVLNQ